MTDKTIIGIDEELAQAKARLIISCIVALLAGLASQLGDYIEPARLMVAGQVIAWYLGFSLTWFLFVRRHPARNHWRRYIGMVGDLVIMAVFMGLGGRHTAFFYPLFLWIIIGNGIRFGRRMLVPSILVGMVCYGSVVLISDYWQANLEVGLGLGMGVIVLPLFFLSVLERLKDLHSLEVELARSREADQAKDMFLAAMSHELRTPMNGVLGMAQALKATELDGEQEEQVEVITHSVESLLHIINDILDFSRLTAESLDLESIPLDLRHILQDVVQLMENAAREKGISLEMNWKAGEESWFLGDPTRIRQMAFNLLGNAVKFTSEGGVQLTVDVGDGGDRRQVNLTVADTGVGIPQERLDAIFQHFEQGDNSTTRQFGGTGLGLAITRQLAELMDGSIQVSSQLGKGSTFRLTISLPRCEKPASQPEVLGEDLPHLGLRALVVEDNPINQMVTTKILKRIGVQATVAVNGQEALKILERESFDVVLMDVRMPVMNGYDATRAIRRLGGRKSRLPILALTGEATRSDVKKCLDSGMDRHLAKPISLEMLLGALEELPQIVASRDCRIVPA